MTPELQERAAVPYVGIRRRVTDGIAAVVDKAFPELFKWIGEHDVTPAGPPFIRYWADDDIEVGAPVAEPVAGAGAVQPGELPAGRYATLVHVGPYRHDTVPDLAVARDELMAWTAERGLEHGACDVEHYRVGPVEERDWKRWETEFAYLVQ
jgi:effector-binding domain-containing protein